MKGARDRLTTLIKRAASGKERVVVTRNGKAIAAIVPIEDLKLLEEIEDRKDIEEARAALAEVEETGTVSWDEIKTELGL
jgi:prevent-host-death family protein